MKSKQYFQLKAGVYANVAVESNIKHQDGKRYASIKNLNIQLHVTHLTLNATYEDVGSFFSGIMDELMVSNWELLIESIIPDMEKYMGDIIKSFFEPIFDKIALEDFSDGQSFLETYPVELDSDSLSRISSSNSSGGSSSRGEVQKSIFSSLVWIALLLIKKKLNVNR